MKKKIKEANDSWGAMLPVNNNKNLVPKLDQNILYSEEEMFRVYDIAAPQTIRLLSDLLEISILKHQNPIAPISALNYTRLEFNRIGYDFDLSQEKLDALKTSESGYIDFPLFSRTSPQYPYQIDQTYPGYRVLDDGIENKLGYKLLIRIHIDSIEIESNGIPFKSKILSGEILPQED